jgi:hypothetical protein
MIANLLYTPPPRHSTPRISYSTARALRRMCAAPARCAGAALFRTT